MGFQSFLPCEHIGFTKENLYAIWDGLALESQSFLPCEHIGFRKENLYAMWDGLEALDMKLCYAVWS